MKQLVFIFCLLSLSTFAQSKERAYKNEFGLDVTSFIQLYTTFGDAQSYYFPNYYLSYRRYFDKSNLRAAIGMDVLQDEVTTLSIPDRSFDNRQFSVSSRLGWEWYSKLSNRWSVFYGLDGIYSYFRRDNDVLFTNAGYVNGSDIERNSFGVAPVLGFRLKLNDRMSLLTEASFAFLLSIENESDTFISTNPSLFLEIPDDVKPESQSFRTLYQQPLSLFFLFTI